MKLNLEDEIKEQTTTLFESTNGKTDLETAAERLHDRKCNEKNLSILTIIIITVVLTILLTVSFIILINKRKKLFSFIQKNIYKKKSKNNQEISKTSKNKILNENVYVKTSELSKSQSITLLDYNKEENVGNKKELINITENLIDNNNTNNSDTLKSKKKLMNALYYNSK